MGRGNKDHFLECLFHAMPMPGTVPDNGNTMVNKLVEKEK
jgi:hypothetical protein